MTSYKFTILKTGQEGMASFSSLEDATLNAWGISQAVQSDVRFCDNADDFTNYLVTYAPHALPSGAWLSASHFHTPEECPLNQD